MLKITKITYDESWSYFCQNLSTPTPANLSLAGYVSQTMQSDFKDEGKTINTTTKHSEHTQSCIGRRNATMTYAFLSQQLFLSQALAEYKQLSDRQETNNKSQPCGAPATAGKCRSFMLHSCLKRLRSTILWGWLTAFLNFYTINMATGIPNSWKVPQWRLPLFLLQGSWS